MMRYVMRAADVSSYRVVIRGAQHNIRDGDRDTRLSDPQQPWSAANENPRQSSLLSHLNGKRWTKNRRLRGRLKS